MKESILLNSFYKASIILIPKAKTSKENYRPMSLIQLNLQIYIFEFFFIRINELNKVAGCRIKQKSVVFLYSRAILWLIIRNIIYFVFIFILYQAQSSLNHCGNFLSDKNDRVLFT